MIKTTTIKTLVSEALLASNTTASEAPLQMALESALEIACKEAGAPWLPYNIEVALKNARGKTQFADAIHGAVVIEYEAPKSFKGQANARYKEACRQAEDYSQLLSRKEGRPLGDYQLVVWDGETISFGSLSGAAAAWESPVQFDAKNAKRLLQAIKDDGRPIVNELVLAQVVGPQSSAGATLIPLFFDAICQSLTASNATKTTLLFTEWSRLFGQVVGIGDDKLKKHIQQQATSHGAAYANNIPAYLFALNSYIALLAKLVVAKAMEPVAVQDIGDMSVALTDRIQSLESGQLFISAGITNMISGDFFCWYADDVAWSNFEAPITDILNLLAGIDFDTSHKSPEAIRDLFKGIYESCVPRELRHALGEFYTPDWLADHGMDVLGWNHENDLLDPTCGSGTFLLSALRKRIEAAKQGKRAMNPHAMLDGIWGKDLNPLAVLAAKASLALFVLPYLSRKSPLRLPVFLADAVNPTVAENGYFRHTLPTEKGLKTFALPVNFVESDIFYQAMSDIQQRIDDDEDANSILGFLQKAYPQAGSAPAEWNAIYSTVDTVVELHNIGWNGIWCSILADRFAAGSITEVSHICGNPPWVKWSHLPREYAKFIKDRCQSIGVFSDDSWVGGIESDISTVITYEAIDRYLKDGGKLGFFITGTVFTNESSEGFRKFSLHGGTINCAIKVVEDYKAIKPFDGVSNHPVFFVVERGSKTRYPVTYKNWIWRSTKQEINTKQDFLTHAKASNLKAKPVPGGKQGSNRPWSIATTQEHRDFAPVFKQRGASYQARKGVTTDRNGIFWLTLKPAASGHVDVENKPSIGRIKGIPTVKETIEDEHVFPLLRGKDMQPFNVAPKLHVLVPQRGMHGNPDLKNTHPDTYRFLKRFKPELERRSSLKRFQKGQAWYSLWSTGAYTFEPHKVVWKEMSGGRFAAAYLGSVHDPILKQDKLVIPDHKLYFITTKSAEEGHFVTGFLNSLTVRKAISSYAAELSLGTSVADYVGIPQFDANDKKHMAVSAFANQLANQPGPPSESDYANLDNLVSLIY